jgi:hypothetical protein
MRVLADANISKTDFSKRSKKNYTSFSSISHSFNFLPSARQPTQDTTRPNEPMKAGRATHSSSWTPANPTI